VNRVDVLILTPLRFTVRRIYTTTFGGIMGFLDDVLGKLGVEGGQQGAISAITNLVNSQGGLQGLVQQLNQGGLGDQVKSWIGTGSNQSVSGEQVEQALGSDEVQRVADQAGTSPDEAADMLAQTLPHLVDEATPQGEIPQEDPLEAGHDPVQSGLG
jgi:uncharacterized protein YidB (DUF937 family)